MLSWKQLQAEHIQAQPEALHHFTVHLKMLLQAFRSLQLMEVPVQIVFALVAIPSSILRIYPKGHPGTIYIQE